MIPKMPPLTGYQVFLQKVRFLDLGSVAYQLMHSNTGPRWTEAKTVAAIARYLAFLYLIDSYPHLQLVPTQEIDQVWHQHILDTSKYAEDCQMLFGRMIHHFPFLGTRGEVDRYNLQQAYVLTQVLLRRHFAADIAVDEALPSDCEPLRLDGSSGCAHWHAPQQRPKVAIEIGEMLRFFPASDAI